MQRQGPAGLAAGLRDGLAMGCEALAIFVAPGAGIADAQGQPVLQVKQFGLAAEGEGLLDRIGDQQDMAACA